MGDLIRTLCRQHTPTPTSRGDLIWILGAHLQPPPEIVGVASFGQYVATFAPHLKVQQSCHLGGHLRPPCGRDVGVKACCIFTLIDPPGRVRSLDRSFVAICVQPPLSCTSSNQGVCCVIRGCLVCLVCSLGLHDVGCASRVPVPPSPFHWGGESLCSCAPPPSAVRRLRCWLGRGHKLPSLLPTQYTKGDAGPDTEESELGSRASGFQNKRRRRPKWLDTPFVSGHPPNKRAVRPASPLAWADGGPICKLYPVCAALTVAIIPFRSVLRFIWKVHVCYPCVLVLSPRGITGVRSNDVPDLRVRYRNDIRTDSPSFCEQRHYERAEE